MRVTENVVNGSRNRSSRERRLQRSRRCLNDNLMSSFHTTNTHTHTHNIATVLVFVVVAVAVALVD